jgi:restriction system protein
MSPSRSRKSIVELYAEPFADLPPLAGIIAGILLVVAGWVAPLFAGGSAMTAIWLQFARWILWFFAVAVLAYMTAGVVRRALDRKTFDSTDDLAGLTWRQFEGYVGEFYRRRGFTVTPRGGAMSDGGVDLLLTGASGERVIVQCKHWKHRNVGVRPLRELWGVMSDEKADGAVFITSDSFTPDAIAFAAGKRLELIDGPRLTILIAAMKRLDGAEARPAAKAAQAPRCPRCGSPMVLRTATRGAKIGEKFWGCSTYPACKGIQPATATAHLGM